MHHNMGSITHIGKMITLMLHISYIHDIINEKPPPGTNGPLAKTLTTPTITTCLSLQQYQMTKTSDKS